MTRCRAAALTALAVLAVVGCSDDGGDQPRPLPSLTASSTPPTEARPGPPPQPSDAEGAEQAARAYYSAVNAAAAAGDSQLVRPYFMPSCSLCSDGAAYVDEVVREGRQLRGFEIVLEIAGTVDLAGDTAAVTTRYRTTAYDLVDGSGAVVQRVPAAPRVEEELVLRRQGASWLVEDIRRAGA